MRVLYTVVQKSEGAGFKFLKACMMVPLKSSIFILRPTQTDCGPPQLSRGGCVTVCIKEVQVL